MLNIFEIPLQSSFDKGVRHGITFGKNRTKINQIQVIITEYADLFINFLNFSDVISEILGIRKFLFGEIKGLKVEELLRWQVFFW